MSQAQIENWKRIAQKNVNKKKSKIKAQERKARNHRLIELGCVNWEQMWWIRFRKFT